MHRRGGGRAHGLPSETFGIGSTDGDDEIRDECRRLFDVTARVADDEGSADAVVRMSMDVPMHP